jgi:quercetin dioxygenase-like cupin family protein
VLLERQGDYVVWGPGVDHSWRAEEESVVLTVRWPSVAGYAVTAGG